jgi:hypothetical protein
MFASGKVWVLLSSLPESSDAVVVSRITSFVFSEPSASKSPYTLKLLLVQAARRWQTTERWWFHSLMTIN